MSLKNNNQPSHGWLIGNRILRWLAGAFVLLALIITISTSMITYAIRRNCNEPYHRRLKILGYWMVIDVGSNKKGCPDSPYRP